MIGYHRDNNSSYSSCFSKTIMEETERLVYSSKDRRYGSFQLLLLGFAVMVVVMAVPGWCITDLPQPPRFSRQPSATRSVVSEGRTKILQCAASGIPQPLYRWLKDGQPLTDFSPELFYKIHNTKRSDAGIYQCVAKNRVGAVYSEKNNVTIAYMGVFKEISEKTIFVESGDAAIIDLPPIDSNPPPSVFWQDQDGPLSYNQKFALTFDQQLVILSCSQEDDKSYRARAINTQLGKEEYSPFIALKVNGDTQNEIPPEIIIKPKDTQVVKGQDTNLQCIANARPLYELETLWFKDEMIIETSGITYNINDPWNRTLTLISASLAHSGQYTCHIRLKSGGYPTITAVANVVVQEKPRLLNNLKTETLGEYGSVVKLDCDVQGEPQPGITWFKDGKKIGSAGSLPDDNQIDEVEHGGGRYSVEEDRSLVVKGLRTEDTGIFQCIADNDAGEASIYTWLKVKTSLPILEQGPSNLTVLDGKDATLPCRAAGAPTPNITWYFNDTAILTASKDTSGRVQILDEGDLLIAGTSTLDTGKYKCVRANEAGFVDGEAFLQVMVRTQIVAPPVDTRVLLGTTATLQCKVSSDSSVPYNIDWFHNKQIMVSGSRVWVGPDGSLEVSAVRASDAGDYTCSVTSPGGNHTRHATLAVIELPFAPTNVRALKVEGPSLRAINISWTPGFDGNSPIKKFIVQKREVPELGPIPDPLLNWITELSNVSSSQRWILLTGLKAASAYQFRVSAINAVGEGTPSEPTGVVTLPQEAPSGPPLGFVGSARSSSEIITQWQPPMDEHRNGHILGYVIRYRLYGYNHSPWTNQNITNAAQRNYLIQDLITWKDYIVQIAAYNDKGVGVFTEGAKIKTKEGVPEAPPVDVKAEAFNSTAISVSWTPPDPQKINGINQGYKLQAWRWDPIEEVNVEKRVMSVPPSLLDPLAEQTAMMGGLEKFAGYNITVVCFTDPGDGERSEYVHVITSQDVPDEVASLQFDEISDRAVKVVWTPPKQSNGILTGYRLKYHVKDFVNTMREEILSANITSIKIEKLEATTFYIFEICAMTAKGDGLAKEASIQSGVKPVLPHAPYNLALSNIEAFSVVLQFTPGFDGNSSISKWTVQAQTARNTSWMTIFDIFAPDAQSIIVKTLVPFTTYRLRLIATNVVGSSAPSAPCKEFQTIQAPPKNAPNNVTVRAVSANDLRVRWIPLQQTEWFGNPKGYNITFKKVNAGTMESVLIEDHTSNSHVLDGLQAWAQYEISVMACNEVGSSPGSPPAIERTREAVPSMGPSNVTANSTSSTTIVVVWGSVPPNHQNGIVEGYKVCYAPLSSPSLPASLSLRATPPECKLIPSNQTHTSTLTELRKYVNYQIQVLAYTRLGDGALSKPPITVQTFEDAPGMPSNVSFPDVSFTTARIIWDVPEDPNGEILAYRVTYHLNSTKELIFSREFLPSDRTFRATGLTSERYYLFTVTAQTRIGWGQTARALVLTTNNRNPPQPPSQPQVSQGQLQPHHITFSWTPGRDGYAPLRYYTVQLRENDATWQSIPERVDPFVTSYTASDLKPFTSYEFRIRATNDIGPSRYSKESAKVRTLPAAPSKSVQGLRVVPITTNSVKVFWTPIEQRYWSGDTETGGYRIVYQPVSDFPTVLQTPLKENVMRIKTDEIVLTDLAVDTNYEIAVGAFNSQGEGPAGPVAAVWVGEAVPTAPPREVAATPLSPTEVHLTWKPLLHSAQNGDLLGYKVFYLVTDSPQEQTLPTGKKIEEEIEIVPATSTSHSLVFLDKYTEYRIQILAFNPAGDGPRSGAISARTHQGLPGPPEVLNFTDITMTSMRVNWDPPKKKNGVIVGYIVTYETTQQNEKFSKQVKQKVSETTLVVGGLEEEVGYTFSVRAMTLDLGPAVWGNVSTGPQPGSPAAPRQLALTRTPAGVDMHWLNSPSGKGPLLGYYIETRKKDDSRWETVTRTSNGPLEDFSISYQTLLPSTGYSFRVIAYNSFGISYPAYTDDIIMTPSKLYLEYGYLQHRPFYRQTWFMVALAAISIIIIIMVIAVLCVKSKSYKYKQEAQKTLEESMAMDAEERGELALDLYRARHNGTLGSTGTLRRAQAGTLGGARAKTSSAHPPALSKSPPRPSPASVAYHSDEESLKDYEENPDDSSVTEKPSEISSSESQGSESENESVRSDPHSFVNHYANVNDSLRQSWKKQKPVRNYSSYTDSEPEGSAVVSLNGGQIIMNNMARSRAPLPGFSSFV